MKLQFEMLVFMVCLNLAFGLVFLLQVAGTEYVAAQVPSDASAYESHFNSTDISKGWGSTPFSGIPVIGDIFAGFQFLIQNFQYLIDGFPAFLNWIGDSLILDAGGRTAFAVITNALRAVYAVLVSIFVIEFISGRDVTG